MGVSTRLMGALIMTHSDDFGLVLPPKLAPFHVVIVPIYKNDEELEIISNVVKKITKDLSARNISVKYDDRNTHKPGWKFSEYELKGVPLRLTLGNRDIKNNTIEIARRDTLEKEVYSIDKIVEKIESMLDSIQENLFKKAKNFNKKNSFVANTKDEFKKAIERGGFVYAHWDGSRETEEKIKNETKATIRCIPLDTKNIESGICLFSGKESKRRVLFAKNY